MSDRAPLESRLGETIRSFTFPIEPGKIAEFARAMKDETAAYYSGEASQDIGLEAIPAPLTFSVAVAHYAGGNAADIAERLGLDLSRSVHGEQRWDYHGAISAGQVLTGKTIIEAVNRVEGRSGEMTRVLLKTDYLDEDQLPVVTEHMLIIELPAKTPS